MSGDGPPGPADLDEPRWSAIDVVWILLVGYAGSTLAIAGLLGALGLHRTGQLPGWALIVAQLPLWAAMGGGAVAVTLRRGNGPVRDLGLAVRPLDIPLGLVAGSLLQFAIPLLYAPFRTWVSNDELERPARDLVHQFRGSGGTVLLIVMVCVMAPVTEELLYRGLLRKGLERRFGPAAGVVGSAVVFGLMHFEALQTIGLVAFGLVAGTVAWRTGRLGASMALHAGFNLTSVVLILHR